MNLLAKVLEKYFKKFETLKYIYILALSSDKCGEMKYTKIMYEHS